MYLLIIAVKRPVDGADGLLHLGRIQDACAVLLLLDDIQQRSAKEHGRFGPFVGLEKTAVKHRNEPD